MGANAFSGSVPLAQFFVARTPLLPFDELLSLSADLRAPTALGDDASLEAAVAEDHRSTRAGLEALLKRPEIREALFLASPDLLARADEVGSLEDAGRVELALARYVFRMCGRPTPFGLCAGFTVGSVGADTAIELGPLSNYGRRASLDNDYLFGLVDRLERDSDLAATLRYAPNSSLYKAAGSFRLAETRFSGKTRTNHLVAVTATDYLETTLECARAGATVPELAEDLAATDPEISVHEATSFIEQLVDSRLLVSDLAPSVVGKGSLDGFLVRLARYPTAAKVYERLQECRSAIEELARSPLGTPRENYVALARRLGSLPMEVELSRFLQVDMVKPGLAAVLGPEPLAEIVRGVELLWRLAPTEKNSAITRFVAAFMERYEGREVPLVEALDEDLGLEFKLRGGSSAGAAPLLDGLNFGDTRDATQTWTRSHDFLNRRLVDLLADGRDELILDASDVEALEPGDSPPLPAAFSVMAAIGASSPSAVARGEFEVVLRGAGGPSGSNMLGRFCHAEPELQMRVAEHLRSEELHTPHAIFAEIVHLPEGRMGNIISRPRMREFEIPYLGCSSAELDKQIPVTDLTLAIEERRLVLRSRRLAREVIPRLTSAHNSAASGLPIYRFLAALQGQGATTGLGWSWGPLASSPFLPRVRSGRVILSPAVWCLSKPDANRLQAARGAKRYRLVQEWRSARRVPRFVFIAEGDHRLPLDLDNVLCVDVLVDIAGRASPAGDVRLEEMLPHPEALLARGPEGRFVHELIVPFVQPPPPVAKRPARVRARINLARSFQPGSEWLYAKLYTSESNADRVLREVIGPLKRMALDRGLADRWFFIRYVDPEHHVRARFHGDPTRLAAMLVPVLRDATEPLLRDSTIRRVQLDTYEREIERYGGDEGMLLSERLFFEDSEAVLEILDDLAGDQGARARSDLALVGVDRLLELFDLDTAARQAFTAQVRDGLGRDVLADKRLRVQLGDKFRTVRRELERLLGGERDEEEGLRVGLDALARRSKRMVPVAAELLGLSHAGRLTVDRMALVSSHIHMFVNRLMRSQQKKQEYVLYDYLHRIYDSRLARSKTAKKAPPYDGR